jgi:hypothetical protein
MYELQAEGEREALQAICRSAAAAAAAVSCACQHLHCLHCPLTYARSWEHLQQTSRMQQQHKTVQPCADQVESNNM